MKGLLITALTCCSLIAADDPVASDQARADLDRMQGGWTRVSTESNGQRRIFEQPRTLLIIAGDKFTFGANVDPEGVKLDPHQILKAIDLTPRATRPDRSKGRRVPGSTRLRGIR